MASRLNLPDIPVGIADAIDVLAGKLASAAGTNLAGLILYGGVARGRFREGRSDVNVVVLLRDASAASLRAVAPALIAARRSAGVEPMILTPDEVREAADVFPTKFLDIKRHHIVLAGEDPFAALEVTGEHVRLRIEQGLRNMLMRLRSRSIDAAAEPEQAVRLLVRIARPLAVELDALLRLSGQPDPASDRTADIFQAAAAAFNLDPAPLGRLAAIRQNAQPDSESGELFAGMLDVIGRAVIAADRMKG